MRPPDRPAPHTREVSFGARDCAWLGNAANHNERRVVGDVPLAQECEQLRLRGLGHDPGLPDDRLTIGMPGECAREERLSDRARRCVVTLADLFEDDLEL